MRLAYVAGLKSETARLTARGVDPALTAAVAGDGAAAARAAQAFAENGAACIVSFGVCGGLDAALRCGDVVLSRTVRGADGAAIAEPTEDDACGALIARLKSGLHAQGRVCVEDPVVAVDEAAATPAVKRMLARHGVAVDMESGGVFRGAERGGAPALVVRAVVDDVETAIPPSALKGFGADGGTPILPVILSALRRPQDWAGLIALGGRMNRALRSLDQAAAILAGAEETAS